METDIQRAYQLAMAIIRVRMGCAGEEERELLLKWLDESDANRQTYKRIIRGEAIREHWKAENSVAATHYDELSKRIAQQLLSRRRRRMVGMWSSVAALLCLGLGVSLWWTEQEKPLPEPATVAVNKVDAKVKLVLSSGEEIDLTTGLAETLEVEEGTAENREGRLVYGAGEQKGEKEILNKVLTTIGGEYTLQLSDGTQVWLNAVSELEFPVRFIGNERVVRLSGEAYFEVARDEAHPFIVEVGGVRTRVLGTSFNIQAYGNEQTVHTTLLSGKVQVEAEASGKSVILDPGTEAVWDKETSQIRKQKVDVADVVAWRNGEFVFVEVDVEVMMRMLARWYEIEFIFDGDRREKHTFSGRMSKYNSLTDVLEMITFAGGPAFRQEGSVIHVIER